MSAVQAARYLLPLVTVPYLARVLRPADFGRLAFASSLAGVCSLLVEFGFNFSATREIARHRGDPAETAKLASGVFGAKLLLAPVLFAVCYAFLGVSGEFRDHRQYLYAAIAFAAAQGFSALWYFQGVEELGGTVARDLAGRLVALAAIFAFVHRPGQGQLVLWFWAGGVAAATFIDYVAILRRLGSWQLRLGPSIQALRAGAGMFLFRLSVALYTTANVFLLGLFLPVAGVADFAGAEKMARATQGLFGPAFQALFPRMSSVVARDRDRALWLGRRILAVASGGGVVAGGMLALGAGWLVPWILGPGYGGAVPLLRVLALLVPLVSASNVLGLLLMLPLGMDKTFNIIIVTAGVINVAGAVVLVPRFGAMGMAASMLVAESGVTVAMGWALGPAVFRGRRRSGAVAQ